MTSRFLRAAASALVLVLGACGSDHLTGADGADPTTGVVQRAGSLALPAGQGGVRLRFAPAAAIDSVLIGAPGAYLVSAPAQGEVVVLTMGTFAAETRFRVFAKPGTDATRLTGQVVDLATSGGDSTAVGASARIVWAR